MLRPRNVVPAMSEIESKLLSSADNPIIRLGQDSNSSPKKEARQQENYMKNFLQESSVRTRARKILYAYDFPPPLSRENPASNDWYLSITQVGCHFCRMSKCACQHKQGTARPPAANDTLPGSACIRVFTEQQRRLFRGGIGSEQWNDSDYYTVQDFAAAAKCFP